MASKTSLLRRLAPWLAAATLLVLWAGCGKPEELDGKQFCEEVGFAIANRTFECQNDPALGNQRYEALRDQYTCQSEAAVQEGRMKGAICPVSSLSCEDVKTLGDDLDWWIAASQCNTWFTRTDGSQVPALLDGGMLAPECTGGTVLCGEVCIDVNNDSANCGFCGAQCPGGTVCIERECNFVMP